MVFYWTWSGKEIMSLSIKQTFYWGIAALALIALASPYPDVATGFAILLIVGVLLTHWKDYVSYTVAPK
jgi:hypothetical protein